MPDNNGRPNHIEDALTILNRGQWFGWTNPQDKIYVNLKLSEKVGVSGNIIDNPITELPTEIELTTKLKELQDAWDDNS